MFYLTNIEEVKNKIYIFGYDENNERVIKKIPYYQELFVPTKKDSKYKSIYGENLRKVEFSSREEYKGYIEERKRLEMKFYGDIPAPIHFIYKYFKKNNATEDIFKKLELKNEILKRMRFFFFDIESAYRGSYVKFKDLEQSNAEINALSFFDTKTKTLCTLGVKDFGNEAKNKMAEIFKDDVDRVIYLKFDTEKELLLRWIKFIKKADIDGLIAYNGDGFDNPYVAWRMKENDIDIKNLSPIKKCYYSSKEIFDNKDRLKKKEYNLKIYGIITIDYWKLYKSLTYKNYSSNSLNAVAEREIGDTKLDFGENGEGVKIQDLNELADVDYEKFIMYNMKDVILMKKIDDKIGFIDNSWLLSMILNCNYNDIFSTIKFYDALIYSELRNENIIIDGKRIKTARKYVGGYVKNDETEGLIPDWYGFHVSHDVDSEYPTLAISTDISPESLLKWNDETKSEYRELYEYWIDMIHKYALPIKEINGVKYDNDNEKNVLKFMVYPNEDYPKFVELIKKYNLTYTPNGKFYRRDIKGFFPKIMKKYFDFRVHLKNLLSENFDIQVKRLEQNIKIVLNSGYGYFGNKYSRYCDVDNIAESITSFGRIEIQTIAYEISQSIWKKYSDLYIKYGIDIDHVVTYSDTDSIYTNIEPIVRQIISENNNDYNDMEIHDFTEKYILPLTDVEIQGYINEALQKIFYRCNGVLNYFGMKREVVADKCVFVGAKHYAMRKLFDGNKRCNYKNELKINGLDIIKSTTPGKLREHLTEFLRYILDNDYEKLRNGMRKTKRMILDELEIDDIAKISSISVSMDEYTDENGNPIKGTPQHVKSAIIYNKLIEKRKMSLPEINTDDKVKLLYLKTPNIIGKNINSIAYKNEYPSNDFFNELKPYIDKEMMFDKLVKNSVDNITIKLGKKLNLDKRELFEGNNIKQKIKRVKIQSNAVELF